MTDPTSLAARLLTGVEPFVTRQPGSYGTETPLSQLTVWSSTHPTPPTPAMFQPMFYVVLRGTRTLVIAGHQLRLSAGACAATSFGLPYVGQVEEASRAAPFVAIGLDLDVGLLTDIMLDMPKAEDRWACSAAAGTLEGPLGDAFVRLVGLLAEADDRTMLGRNYEAELYFRLLQSSMGDTLRQLGRQDSRSRQIKVAADWLCSNPEKPVVIPHLAASVGMSLTSFHRHFRAVTGYSPLAFQRQMRLLEARRLLAGGGISVSRAAYSLGYASPSQFSREYKTLFGSSPSSMFRDHLEDSDHQRRLADKSENRVPYSVSRP